MVFRFKLLEMHQQLEMEKRSIPSTMNKGCAKDYLGEKNIVVKVKKGLKQLWPLVPPLYSLYRTRQISYLRCAISAPLSGFSFSAIVSKRRVDCEVPIQPRSSRLLIATSQKCQFLATFSLLRYLTFSGKGFESEEAPMLSNG